MYTLIFSILALMVTACFMWVAITGIATGNMKPTKVFLSYSKWIMFALVALLILALALDGVLFSGTITNYF